MSESLAKEPTSKAAEREPEMFIAESVPPQAFLGGTPLATMAKYQSHGSDLSWGSVTSPRWVASKSAGELPSCLGFSLGAIASWTVKIVLFFQIEIA